MRKVLLLLFFLSKILYAQNPVDDFSLFEEYIILLTDLVNTNTNGYKSHLLDIDIDKMILEDKGGKEINFSQGSLFLTKRDLDFAIIGEGFLK